MPKKSGMPFRSFYLALLFQVLVHSSFLLNQAVAQLFPNLVGEQTGTLPKSRWMVSVAQINGPLQNRFDSRGNSSSFSSLFNRNVTWNQVLDDEPVRKEQVAGLLLANGTSPDSLAGSLNGSFNGKITTTVPVLGYGLTDRIGLFMVLPVLKFEVKSNAGFVSSAATRQLLRNLENSGQLSTAREFSANFSSSFSKQLERAGYRFNSNYDETFLGDLRLEVPWVISDQKRPIQLTFSQTVVLPTAQRAPVSELFGFFGGQGRWMLGTRAILGAQLPGHRKLGFTGSLGGLLPFSRSIPLRMTSSDSVDLVSDVDPNATVSGGAQVQAFVSTHYQWNRTIRSLLSFQYQEIFDRTFTGTRFGAEKYQAISSASGESLQSIQVSVEFNSIAAFLSGDFVMPGVLNLGAAVPLSGRNTLASTAWMLQGSMFF